MWSAELFVCVSCCKQRLEGKGGQRGKRADVVAWNGMMFRKAYNEWSLLRASFKYNLRS